MDKREYCRKYYRENREIILESRRGLRYLNIEKAREAGRKAQKAYYLRNKEKVNEKNRKYYEQNKEKRKELNKRYYLNQKIKVLGVVEVKNG